MANSIDYMIKQNGTCFYVASGDKDLLRQVSNIMQRSGMVGVFDTAGRVHYLVDGKKGAPYATRKIIEKTGQIAEENDENLKNLESRLPAAAAEVLDRHGISPELKGYRYLRFMILAAGLDERKLMPISKTLYPLTAERFHVKAAQIERDIRYALSKTLLKKQGYTATSAMCRFYDETIQTAVKMQEKAKPPAVYKTAGGSL